MEYLSYTKRSITADELIIQISNLPGSFIMYENNTKSRYIFDLFDDSKRWSNINDILSFESDYKFSFYYDNHQCHFDVFMMACYIGDLNLIKELLTNDKNNFDKLNKKYTCGTNGVTTPFVEIHNHYYNENGFENNFYKHIKNLGDFNIRNDFGILLISST